MTPAGGGGRSAIQFSPNVDAITAGGGGGGGGCNSPQAKDYIFSLGECSTESF